MRITTLTVALLCSITETAAAQTAWPCPQSVSPRDLGYNGEISFSGKAFAVAQLSLTTTGPDPEFPTAYSGVYVTVPATPIDLSGDYWWKNAAVYTRCQRVPWVNPATGQQIGIVLVQEVTKSGTVAYRWGYGGGCQYDENVSSTEYDPYSSSQEPGDTCTDGSGGSASDPPPDGGGGADGADGVVFVGAGSGGGAVCGGSSSVVYDNACIDIWVDGEGWVEYWCGTVAVC